MPNGDKKCVSKLPGNETLPPGGGDWTCAAGEFGWTCTAPGLPSGGSGMSSGSGEGEGGGGSSGGGGTPPLVCSQWYAAKWQTNGANAGACEAIPGNVQDCDSIRTFLGGALPGPLTNGACSVAPVSAGASWVITLPAGCQFVPGGVCGKYGGNVFVNAGGSQVATLPVQQGTGLSHLEFIYCCQ